MQFQQPLLQTIGLEQYLGQVNGVPLLETLAQKMPTFMRMQQKRLLQLLEEQVLDLKR